MSEIIIIKRDGSEEDFDIEKISNSIMAAAMQVGGEDMDLAEELAEQIAEMLDENDWDSIDTEHLQNIIEKTLIEEGHAATAKEYILKAADRKRMREMDSELMHSFEEITFKSEEESDIKRENANIDSSTAMGTMLKYGSESAKKFNLIYMMSDDIAMAHKNGDIHIHDLDFLALTETCVSGDTELVVKFKDKVEETKITAKELYDMITARCSTRGINVEVDTIIDTRYMDLKIKSAYQLATVYNIVAHKIDGKRMLEFITPIGKLNVTNDHTIVVQRDNVYIEIKAEDAKVDDLLFAPGMDTITKNVPITEIKEIPYDGLVYDLQTSSEHFNANGFYVHNCLQIPLDKLFENGFNTGHGFLRQPGSIRSASALAAIAIQSNQNDQHGGQSIPMFDYYLAPYVAMSYARSIAHIAKYKLDLDTNLYKQLKRKLLDYQTEHKLLMNDEAKKDIITIIKDLFTENNIKISKKRINNILDCAYEDTYDETFQAMEAFIHNLNTMHSRAGAQVPFSSINYGTDTSTEGRMIMETVLLTTEQGLGNGETPIFPIQIFKMKEGISCNEDDTNYDLYELSCRVSAKRLYPNFVNLDAPYNAILYKEGRPETEMATMGCRTRVGANVYDPDKSIIPGRGNLSFTSINLPRIAILSRGDIDKFFKLLDARLELVHRQLLERFNIQCSKHPINYPFLMGQGLWLGSEKLGPNDDIKEILRHGTLGVGFIGLAETLTSLIGKHHGESEEAQELGLKIVQHMRDYTDAWSENEKMNYSVIGTPAEGLSGRFVRMDRELYGEIPGVTDKDYYTNSSHVPVRFKISAFKKIEIEAPYHSIENGGHIVYIELDGDPTKNLTAFKKIIKYMHDKNCGYMAINHPVDRDSICGYVGIIDDVCPRCGRRDGEAMTMEMWNKIKGYANVGNADTLGYQGSNLEEVDRVSNNIDETPIKIKYKS